jgi:L-threonylcarbamoyladenylate synthase
VSPWQLRVARRVLQAGGVIAYPTEAVYGLGCDPWSATAVALLAIKQRPAHKGLILVAADQAQLDPFVDWSSLPAGRRPAVLASWPGPVTWLLPAHPGVPGWLRGRHASIAVRVSAHPVVRDLCSCFGGALVSTSANRAGMPPARSALTVERTLGGAVDYLLHGDLGGLTRPTEIRDGSTGEVVRAG